MEFFRPTPPPRARPFLWAAARQPAASPSLPLLSCWWLTGGAHPSGPSSSPTAAPALSSLGWKPPGRSPRASAFSWRKPPRAPEPSSPPSHFLFSLSSLHSAQRRKPPPGRRDLRSQSDGLSHPRCFLHVGELSHLLHILFGRVSGVRVSPGPLAASSGELHGRRPWSGPRVVSPAALRLESSFPCPLLSPSEAGSRNRAPQRLNGFLQRPPRRGNGGSATVPFPSGGRPPPLPFIPPGSNHGRPFLIGRPETPDTPSRESLLKSPPKIVFLPRSPRPEKFQKFYIYLNSFKYALFTELPLQCFGHKIFVIAPI